ncbi:glutathione-S-transferase [Mycena galericulata]|nr:glutathione-S-transferase [Mycena galericulata]
MPVPDEEIFPHATGTALLTAEAHKAPQDLIFYAGWFCPYVQRSWIALEEKGIPYQYKEVNPYKKEKHFLDINPKGLVPAVEYQGKALYESLVLCEFLEDAYPSHKPSLLPGDAYTKAYARIWVDYVNKAFAQETDKRDLFRTELYDVLRKFAEKVKGPYFLGEEFSLVDIALVPWITRDYILAEHRGYNRQDQYAGHVEQRESVLKTKSDKEKYAQIYGRYLRDEAQSEAAKAIRAGRPIP